MPGTLFVVATPIGNLEDISARALRVLREVSIIAAEDTRRTAKLLARYAITTPTTSLHEHNEHRKSSAIIERLRAGEHVAVVSDAGTPTVSDPGQRLIREAIDHGIRVESIPGPSAVMTALAASGFPADSFTFLGFPPVRSTDRKVWFDRLRDCVGTVVFFEAPHRIRETLAELQRVVGDVRVFVGRELTKTHEQLVVRPISEVIGDLLVVKGEFTVVTEIGHITDRIPSQLPDAAALQHELGLITEKERLGRRQAIARLASKYGRKANEVYALLEAARK